MEGRTEMREFEDRVLTLVRKAEDAALENARRWAGVLSDMAPGDMPVARRLVEETLDFTAKVMELQRGYVDRVVEALHVARTTPARRRTPASPTTASPRAQATSSRHSAHPSTRKETRLVS